MVVIILLKIILILGLKYNKIFFYGLFVFFKGNKVCFKIKYVFK